MRIKRSRVENIQRHWRNLLLRSGKLRELPLNEQIPAIAALLYSFLSY